MSLETKDPTVAVLIDRVARLTESFAELREEMRLQSERDAKAVAAQIGKAQEAYARERAEIVERIDVMEKKLDVQTEFFTKAKGVWWVLGIVVFAGMWVVGAWDKIMKVGH